MQPSNDIFTESEEAFQMANLIIQHSMLKDIEKEYQNIRNLAEWMKTNNLESYDLFDVQSSSLYMWLISKTGHLNSSKYFLFAAEKFIPRLSRMLLRVKKKKAATTSAVYASACFEMYKATKNPKWLYDGCGELDWLVENKSSGYSGACWGLPFDWAMGDNVIAKTGTPYSTIMIYMIDALLAGYRATINPIYRDCAVSTIDFFMKDLHQEIIDENTICSAYSPLDRLKVVNVNTYVAVSLYELYKYSNNKDSIVYADKLINYVMKNQNDDGSWPYFAKNSGVPNSEDSLHQCYIIENLFRCYLINKNGDILNAVTKGVLAFYDKFYDNGVITKFSPANPSSKYYTLELMDAAETVAMCELLLRDDVFEHQSDIAIKLRRMRSEVFHKTEKTFKILGKPYYKSKLRVSGVDIPYMRWGLSQWFYAMAVRYKRKHGEITS